MLIQGDPKICFEKIDRFCFFLNSIFLTWCSFRLSTTFDDVMVVLFVLSFASYLLPSSPSRPLRSWGMDPQREFSASCGVDGVPVVG